MPKNKMKPFKCTANYYPGGHALGSDTFNRGKNVEGIFIPLTPASRKVMIEAIEKGIVRDLKLGGDALIDKVAEAALSALENLCKTKP
jgi:hypothetical protein